jgi:hypothetical protein
MYINRTGINSPIAKIVKLDTDPRGVVLALPADTSVLGVVTTVTLRSLEVEWTGIQRVFICNKFNKGDTVYLRKYNERGRDGECYAASAPTVPYVKVGECLEDGSGRAARVKLSIAYTTTETAVGGTMNTIAKFTAADTVGNSGLTDDGTDISTTENFKIASDSKKVFLGAGGDMTAWYDGTDGNIKTSDVAASDLLIHTGTAKTIELQTVVWDDMRIVPNVFDVPGGTDPDVISYQPGGSGATFKVYAFAKGDEGFFTIQLPHSYHEGSDMKAHVHWTPGPRGNEENGNVVQWRLDYSAAAINGNFPASGTLDLSDVCDGTDHKHQMTAEVTLPGAGLSMSSQIWGRIYRWNDASDTWAGTGNNLPIFIEFDVHYAMNTLGSRLSGSK